MDEQALDIRLEGELRLAARADWRQVGGIIAEAFAEDPVNLWIFGNEAAMPPVFGALARGVYLKRGICHVSEDAAATMWCRSSASRELGLFDTLGLVSAVTRKGSKGAAQRGLTAAKIMEHEHPKAPHLYLFAIGTRKAARGKGLGKAMMAPMLSAADRAGMPCYLENSNPANTGFYRSHGFERMKLFTPGDGAPVMEAMWREPRGLAELGG